MYLSLTSSLLLLPFFAHAVSPPSADPQAMVSKTRVRFQLLGFTVCLSCVSDSEMVLIGAKRFSFFSVGLL